MKSPVLYRKKTEQHRLIKKRCWHKNYQLLVEFKNKHGHTRVVRSTEKKLGNWVDRQRMFHKRGVLAADFVKKLNDIGFNWQSRSQLEEKKWDQKLQLLIEFKRIKGHFRVPPGNDLGVWLKKQRTYYKSSTLSEDRVRKLNDIGFDWTLSIRGEAIDHGFQQSIGNNVRQQQQQQQQATTVTTVIGSLIEQPFTSSTTTTTTTPIPQDVTSQPFIEMDDDNGDSHICEEFKETTTYPHGDSEYWV
mmetsp:Transcript_8215/g.12598  ORF Transcript_8215/g.12598 Transcript_8215/m.12598 type:complete len:246 (+) Transcript_8215:352-1089(+)|eukprot:CAMPEP_0195288820 /NCGR_PEP_ID=MMETSP0707-20130614/5330_1 /TAXON_ID=33640 /ORGANISM="Asterionellopsis glacialis, Strain CCMP134" /LENGTH=245 /DNA_ID=CAMNT_0040348727 /DNA_START=339 /DNA_END=1076 /DNA_ORIENTATION=-